MGKLTHWAVVFAALAVFYAVLGFGGFAGSGSSVAKVLCGLTLSAAIVMVAGGFVKNHW
jgi:uncharacterized membrane protein YtjA (UPF0391 family)